MGMNMMGRIGMTGVEVMYCTQCNKYGGYGLRPEHKRSVVITHLLWSCESPLDGSLLYHPVHCQTVVDVQEKRFSLTAITSSF